MEPILPGKKSHLDEKAAAGASLALHALFFLVLTANSDFTLPLGHQTRIDLLWLATTPSQPAESAAPVEAAHKETLGGADAKTPARLEPTASLPAVIATSTRRSALRQASPPRSDEAGEILAVKSATPAAAVKTPTTLPIPPQPMPSPPVPSQPVHSKPMPPEPVLAQPVPEPTSGTVTAGEPAGFGPPPAPTEHQEEVTGPSLASSASASAPAPDPAPVPISAPNRTTNAAPIMAAAAKAPREFRPGPAPGAKAGEGRRPGPEENAQRQPSGPRPVAAPPKAPAVSPASPVEERGLTVASLKGDLKLLSSGDSVRITAAFREFPISRRHKPGSKGDARRRQEIVPLCAQKPDGTGEAVIEKTGEGIYTFSAEPRGQGAAQANFALKIYEAEEARSRVVQLGRRTVRQKNVVAKVLMPEAILWDDEHAFTGSLQDSESTTKFNTQTGLYWKEYDD